MTTTVAENLAGHSGEKEKPEKRRALGRGLESLLPGPRVKGARPVVAPANPVGVGAAELHSAGPFDSAQGRQPGAAVPTQTVASADAMQAVEEIATVSPEEVAKASAAEEMRASSRAGVPSTGAQGRSAPHGAAELRSAGQPGAAAPTLTPPPFAKSPKDGAPSEQQVPHPGFARVRNDISTLASPAVLTEMWPHEGITIHGQAEARTPGNLVVNIPLDQIDKNPYQTRYLFDDELMQEMADSIRAQGVVQPVVVRPGEDGRYILVLGERRCRASRMAGKTSIPAIVKRVSAQQAAEMTVIENLQRQDLNCLEQAEAFRVLSKEFNLTQQEIGDRVGMSRESVANYMRLLKLPPRVLEYLGNNQLGFSEARQLLTLDDPEVIAKAADEVVKKHLSIEQIEDLVIRLEALPQPKKAGGARWVDPNVRAAQMDLERLLGLRVRIRDRKGKGKIVIEYSTVDDYERVVAMLKGK